MITRRKIGPLVVAVMAIALVWGVILPAVAQIPSVSARIDWFRQHNINGTARFYTELDQWPSQLNTPPPPPSALGKSPAQGEPPAMLQASGP